MTETPKTDAASVEVLVGYLDSIADFRGDPGMRKAATTLRALLAERDHAQDLLHAREQDMHDLAKRDVWSPIENIPRGVDEVGVRPCFLLAGLHGSWAIGYFGRGRQPEGRPDTLISIQDHLPIPYASALTHCRPLPTPPEAPE